MNEVDLELFSLSGRTVVVTGATGLLGQQHCRALADAGAAVIVTDLDADRCESVAAGLGPNAHAVPADITDESAVRTLRTRALEISGAIDVLVNNAAVNDHYASSGAALEQSRFEYYPLALWQQCLNVNVTGMFLCCQILGQVLAQQGHGSIINIASTYGVVAPDQSLYKDAEGRQRFYKSPVYPTSKGAVLAFTRYLASYWGHRQVRVNSLSPGGVEDHQEACFVERYAQRTPLGRMAMASDYRGALIFLASDASAYMTGANLIIDGGFTIW